MRASAISRATASSPDVAARGASPYADPGTATADGGARLHHSREGRGQRHPLRPPSRRGAQRGRSKQEVAREAIHAYLTDQVRRIEDLEDELAVARYRLRRQLGEVTYVSQAEARSSLGLPPAPPRSAST